MARGGNLEGQIMRSFASSQNSQVKLAHMLKEDKEGNGKDLEGREMK